jgi:hypothetical protein
MDITKFDIDESKEQGGVWVDISSDSRLLVAALNNQKQLDYLDRITKPYKRAIKNKTIDKELSDKLYCKSLAKHVLLDWEGMREHGKEVPYSKEKALEWLLEYPKFRQMVLEIAQDESLYLKEEQEEDEKN